MGPSYIMLGDIKCRMCLDISGKLIMEQEYREAFFALEGEACTSVSVENTRRLSSPVLQTIYY